ncbi:MAG: hypothetical protein WBP53_14135 [Dokdonella sp.]
MAAAGASGQLHADHARLAHPAAISQGTWLHAAVWNALATDDGESGKVDAGGDTVSSEPPGAFNGFERRRYAAGTASGFDGQARGVP